MKAVVAAFSVIVKTGCGTDGALHSTSSFQLEDTSTSLYNQLQLHFYWGPWEQENIFWNFANDNGHEHLSPVENTQNTNQGCFEIKFAQLFFLKCIALFGILQTLYYLNIWLY